MSRNEPLVSLEFTKEQVRVLLRALHHFKPNDIAENLLVIEALKVVATDGQAYAPIQYTTEDDGS